MRIVRIVAAMTPSRHFDKHTDGPHTNAIGVFKLIPPGYFLGLL